MSLLRFPFVGNVRYVATRGRREVERSMTIQQPVPISILIIDDHAVLRFGLRAILESQPHLSVVGEAMDGSTALALATAKQPDIVLLDLDLGKENGFDLIQSILDAA